MIEGLVSTIIPVFNRAAMLREAVGSVLAQSWRPIEIVIVDDGSTDDTPRAAEALRAEHPDIIRVLHRRNQGPGAARQAGLESAAGEFVQFLKTEKKYWLAPIVVVFVLLGLLIVFSQSSAVAPFIYTLF